MARHKLDEAEVGGTSARRPAFRTAALLALVLTCGFVVRADEPVLRWESVASTWDEFKLAKGSGAVNMNTDDFLEGAGTAPRSGSVPLGTPFQLGLRRFERDADGDLRGIDVSVIPRSERFKTCGQGADPKQDGYESTCRDFSFHGSRAVWIQFQNIRDFSHRGNLIKVEIDPENVVQIFSTQSGSQDLLAKFQKMFEIFVSTLRIEGGAPPAKRSYHAEIRLPRNLRPGDVLSPDVVVFDQDGNVAENIIQEVFFIDGREAGSIRWDGSRTRIEVQVSMKDGQAVTASGVIPAASSPEPEPEPSQPESTPVPAPETSPEARPEPPPTGEVPGLGGIGNVPGPRTIGEAVVSILGPAAVGLLGALLSGMAGGGEIPVSPPPGKPAPTPQEPPKGPVRKKRKTGEKKEPPPPPPHPGKSEKAAKEKDDKKKSQQDKENAEKDAAAKDGKQKKPKKRTQRKVPAEPLKKEGYWTRIARRIKDGVKAGASDIADAAKDIYRNPGLIVQTAKNAGKEVYAETKAAARGVAKGFRYVGKKVVDIVKHPLDTLKSVKDAGGEILGTVKEIFLHPADFASSLGYAVTRVKDVASGVGSAVWGAITKASRDPDKLVDLVKSVTGLEDYEKSIESDRSLGSRLIHSVLGALGVYGAAEGVAAAGKGTARLLRGGRSVVSSVGDDAARLAIKAAGKGKGLADDAARAGSRVAAGGTDDTARTARALEKRAASSAQRERVLEGVDDFVDAPHVVPNTSGYVESAQRRLQEIADRFGIEIYARPTTPRASKLLRNGEAIPKPVFVKNKTINAIDAKYLGAAEKNIAKVGSFKPRRPSFEDLKALSASDQQKVMSRYHMRLKEYKDQAQHLIKNSDRCFVKNGVVHDRLTGKPFTGDIDIFGYRGASGERLNPATLAKFEQIVSKDRTLSKVMHGGLENWDLSKLTGHELAVAKGIKGTIRGSHGIGGEALVKFKPGGTRPTAAWTNTAIPLSGPRG